MEHQFVSLSVVYPPKNTLIDWITPTGKIVREKWAGGAVWFPEGSSTYIYYTPLSWRLANADHRKERQ